MHREDLAQLQRELNESQELIFGEAIGCSRATDVNVTSGMTCPHEMRSRNASEDMGSSDYFGLESDDNHNDSDRSEEWVQAENLMSNYRTILQRRDELSKQAHLLDAANTELQKELKAKLEDAKVNKELKFPPSLLL